MKYIRTEKGVYELKNNMFIENAVYCLFGKFEKTNKKHLFRNDKDLGEVVNQADTPGELCDEFRYKMDGVPVTILSKHQRCWKNLDNGKWYDYDTCIELSEKEVSTIRGGIWTDEGFTYVLKMNNEGNLV